MTTCKCKCLWYSPALWPCYWFAALYEDNQILDGHGYLCNNIFVHLLIPKTSTVGWHSSQNWFGKWMTPAARISPEKWGAGWGLTAPSSASALLVTQTVREIWSGLVKMTSALSHSLSPSIAAACVTCSTLSCSLPPLPPSLSVCIFLSFYLTPTGARRLLRGFDWHSGPSPHFLNAAASLWINRACKHISLVGAALALLQVLTVNPHSSKSKYKSTPSI